MLTPPLLQTNQTSLVSLPRLLTFPRPLDLRVDVPGVGPLHSPAVTATPASSAQPAGESLFGAELLNPADKVASTRLEQLLHKKGKVTNVTRGLAGVGVGVVVMLACQLLLPRAAVVVIGGGWRLHVRARLSTPRLLACSQNTLPSLRKHLATHPARPPHRTPPRWCASGLNRRWPLRSCSPAPGPKQAPSQQGSWQGWRGTLPHSQVSRELLLLEGVKVWAVGSLNIYHTTTRVWIMSGPCCADSQSRVYLALMAPWMWEREGFRLANCLS